MAQPSRLFVVADGPREAHPTDEENCRRVREVILQGVDWPCELVTDYSDVNLGCARRVSSGITSVLNRVPEAIILEDDCIPDLSFLPFCEELLSRYRENSRVGQVGGYTFTKSDSAGEKSYHFSRYPHCWGWATWRRAWRWYDHEMTGCLEAGGLAWLDDWIPNPREREVWRKCFVATARGEIDSWAYRWTYSLWRQRMLSANPSHPLVTNIGFGADATHTRTARGAIGKEGRAMQFPLNHPKEVEVLEAADADTSRTAFLPRPWTERIARRVAGLFG